MDASTLGRSGSPFMLPSGLPPSPFVALDPAPPPTPEPAAMSIAYGPTAVLCKSDDDLFYAFVRTVVGPSGAILPAEYLNHDTGAWEAAFSAAAHVRPMTRLAPAGSVNGRWQCFAARWATAALRGVVAVAYTKDAAGALVEWGFPNGSSIAFAAGVD